MSLGQEQRNLLRSKVQAARERLTQELTEVLEGTYGIHRSGRFEDVSRLPVLVEDEHARETRDLLERLLPETPKTKAAKKAFAEHFDATMRGIAFTHLNRLVAFKMMEHPERKLIKETVGRYTKSRGFLFYLADHPEEEQLYKTGREDDAFRHFLRFRCAELNEEIGVLFDPGDLASRIYPRPRALQDVLVLINDDELDEVWRHDEALGWTYQYYTPKELRDKARKESKKGPRNSYELAFLNQFYTPDYVVRFLTDNTLGRLWLEMKHDSQLRDQCEYLLVLPDEELPQRPKKDPREIRVLDPACGSGHFLLYAFDLLHTIYLEAWADDGLGPLLKVDFESLEAFRDVVPALIVEHNLHGIDIDRRATQIASLALHLKAKTAGATRPIERSGIACAEPMPGGRAQLQVFKDAELGRDNPVLGRILDALWQQMELAGEAGSLLKMEASLVELIEKEKETWLTQKRRGGLQQSLLDEERDSEWVDYGDLRSTSVFENAVWKDLEEQLRSLFDDFAAEADGAEAAQRRLFAHDGSEVLRFIELLRQRYDVVLMNPPFGAPTAATKPLLARADAGNLYPAFVRRASELGPAFIGAVTDRTFTVQASFASFREWLLAADYGLTRLVDLGWAVLDANVQVAAYVVAERATDEVGCCDVRHEDSKARTLANLEEYATVRRAMFSKLPASVLAYKLPASVVRLVERSPQLADEAKLPRGLGSNKAKRTYRFWAEVPPQLLGAERRWAPLANGGEFSPFYRSDDGVADWLAPQGVTWVSLTAKSGWRPYDQSGTDDYFRAGLCFPKQSSLFNVAVLSEGFLPTREGKAILAHDPGRTWFLLGWLNSGVVRAFVRDTCGLHKQSGAIGRVPIPNCSATQEETVAAAAREICEVLHGASKADETSRWFATRPDPYADLDAAQAKITSAIGRIESTCAEICGLDSDDAWLEASVVPAAFEPAPLDILSWALGVAFGRNRLEPGAQGDETVLSKPPDLPYALVPPEQHPTDPDLVDDDGILVSVPGHSDDVVAQVRQVFARVWPETSDEVEREVVAAADAEDLRGVLSDPGTRGFFAFHLSRFTGARRRGPVYWMLQSPRKSFTAWVYAHRLDSDSLLKLLGARYLEAEIRRTQSILVEEQEKPDPKSRVVGQLEETLSDLEEFERRLKAVVELRADDGDPVAYEPTLSDGVVLSAAPLADLTPWPASSGDGTELHSAWAKLAAGECDWAQVAMRYWPDRVRARCEKERHMAIAHGLEAEFFPDAAADATTGGVK